MTYMCENSRFRTNITKGEPHGRFSSTRGSVFPEPLANYGDHTLWLEHVEEPRTQVEWYWLMWYDKSGRPTIKVSGVLAKRDLSDIAKKLEDFVRDSV